MLFKQGKQIVLAIPDLHCPFEHKDALPFLKAVKDRFKPNKIVCLGDEIDAYALSTYDHGPDTYSAGHELEQAIKHLEPYYKAFPNVFVCTSNHTNRIVKKSFKAGIPEKFLKSFAEILEAPEGWVWKDRWVIDDVVYEHGEGFSGAVGAMNAAKANMKSTVIGHLHSFAGVAYISNPYEMFFGVNSGCLIDTDTYAFTYSKYMKSKPTLGCTIVDKGVPYFIPMIENKFKRWCGKL